MRDLGYTFTLDVLEQVSYEQSLHAKATHHQTPAQPNTQNLQQAATSKTPLSPLLPGDDEDVVEEEEVHFLLPRRPPEEDAVVLYEGGQLSPLHHPPGGGDERERLDGRKIRSER